MNNRLKLATIAIFGSFAILSACGNTGGTSGNVTNTPDVQNEQAETNNAEQQLTKGQTAANILSNTNWQGTRVYDKDNNDLTKENAGFIGLAKYDYKTGRYEFFDAKTEETRGDEGTFFVTNDGMKRILVSNTMKYQAVVDITALDEQIFTYKRVGKDAKGNDIEVFVEHVPYKEDLAFTEQDRELVASTGDINTSVDGDKILGKTLWQGTKVLDEKGNDVTEYNTNFLSVAKFEEDTNKYEFFNMKQGKVVEITVTLM